jgi:hypothetical protein
MKPHQPHPTMIAAVVFIASGMAFFALWVQ